MEGAHTSKRYCGGMLRKDVYTVSSSIFQQE